MQKPFDDFTTQIQSDELAAKSGEDKFNEDWEWDNDFDTSQSKSHDGDIIDD